MKPPENLPRDQPLPDSGKYLICPGAAARRGTALGVGLRDCLAHERALRPDLKRVRQFEKILESMAPHWLEEAEAFAKAAGFPLAGLLHANCRLSEPPVIGGGGCTSVLAVGADSADGRPLLLKVRDEKPLPQYACVRDGGKGNILYGTNAANLGWAHFQNAAGLAGINNTGSPVLPEAPSVALNDCHILRLVAERAGTCEEALEVLRELALGGYCGTGGYRKGMIFLFADAAGGGLVVEVAPGDISHQFMESGAWVCANHFLLEESARFTDFSRYDEVAMESSRARWRRGLDLVALEDRPVSVELLKRISRDKANGKFAICNDGGFFPWKTISGCIYHLRTGSFEVHLCNGSPSVAGFHICTSLENPAKPFAVPAGLPQVSEEAS